jgi:PAS domain-containing protein
LYLGGIHDEQLALRERLGDDVQIVVATSPARALSDLNSGEFAGVYADAEQFAEVLDIAQIVRNERILQGMPDGVVMLNSENVILWGNGRLREWSGREVVIGANFYEVMGTPDILGPDYCPFHTALSTRRASASTLRCFQNRYMRVHAAPVIEGDDPPQHLIVTLRD